MLAHTHRIHDAQDPQRLKASQRREALWLDRGADADVLQEREPGEGSEVQRRRLSGLEAAVRLQSTHFD